jgi:hypothetical protein
MFAAALTLAISLMAQPAAGYGENGAGESSFDAPLNGRHEVAIHIGFLNTKIVETETGTGGVDTETRANGFLGSLSYNYWAGSEWTIGVSAGLLDVETSSSTGVAGVVSESAGVVPLLFGASVYPAWLTLGSSVRPYGSVAVGPYIGFATNSTVGTTVAEETVVESVVGARVRAGADVFVSDRFKIGIAAGYHFVGDFEEKIGKDKDYSGPEFALGFGVLWGSGK